MSSAAGTGVTTVVRCLHGSKSAIRERFCCLESVRLELDRLDGLLRLALI